jgi:hypothetical protein
MILLVNPVRRRHLAEGDKLNQIQIIMKSGLLIAAAFVLAVPAFAEVTPNPPTVLTLDSEVKELARGYAAAFSQLSRPPLTLAFQKEGVLRVLEDVKQVRAAEGVLVVEVGRGIVYVINPKDVVYLTDGSQLPKKVAP